MKSSYYTYYLSSSTLAKSYINEIQIAHNAWYTKHSAGYEPTSSWSWNMLSTFFATTTVYLSFEEERSLFKLAPLFGLVFELHLRFRFSFCFCCFASEALKAEKIEDMTEGLEWKKGQRSFFYFPGLSFFPVFLLILVSATSASSFFCWCDDFWIFCSAFKLLGDNLYSRSTLLWVFIRKPKARYSLHGA